jgi:RNA polymerase sigma-70 factor, ECF subfamily
MARTLPVQFPDIDSLDLLARARAGDGESFRLLCEPLKDRIVRQAFVLCRNEALAQDLAQETLVEAWKSLRSFHGRCQFATWLGSILLHRHKSAARRAAWRAVLARFTTDHDQAAIENVRDHGPAPDHAAQLSERSRLILESLDRLPPRQREVIFLRFYTGESLAGIAAAMNCSLGTAKSRLFHGLENLRRMNVFTEEIR